MKRCSALVLAVFFFLVFSIVFVSTDECQSISIDDSSYGSKVQRLWGADRYKTAKVIAEQYASGLVDHVVLVHGDNFNYALPATVLAHQKNAPLLMINRTTGVSTEALEYIQKHLRETGIVYLIGDINFVNSELERTLAQSGHTRIIKICGENKTEINIRIAKELDLQKDSPIVITTGEDYSDALSISSFAASNGWPILFSKGDSILQPLKEYLEKIHPSQIYILGGKEAVSSFVEEEIAVLKPNSEIIRFSGKDRYETSVLIAKEFAPNPQNIFVASGRNFPDAIAGGVLAARTTDPVILINPERKNDLPTDFKQYLNNRDLQSGLNIICLGGYEAVPISLEKLLKDEIMIVYPYDKYNYEQMLNDMERIHRTYPEIVELESIGQSVENRELMLLKLGKGESKVFLNGSFHGREYITTTFLMKMIDEYAYAYSNKEKFVNFDVNMLLDNITLFIIPMVNPDGVNLVQNGINAVKDPEQIKSMRMIHPHLGFPSWKANLNGVDLNRNFPVGWNVKATNTNVPSSENYKGIEPMTEPETRAIMDLVKDNDFKIIVSYHSQGEDIFWSDKNCSSFNHILEPMADRLVHLTGYKKGSKVHAPGDWGSGIADWTRLQKIPTFTVEVCPYRNNLPYPDSKFDDVWERVKETGLFFAQEAINLSGFILKPIVIEN